VSLLPKVDANATYSGIKSIAVQTLRVVKEFPICLGASPCLKSVRRHLDFEGFEKIANDTRITCSINTQRVF
jgi:hypothetical protein